MYPAFHLNGNTIGLSSSRFFFLLGKEDTGTRDYSAFNRFYTGLLGGILSGTEQARINSKNIERPFWLFGIPTHSPGQNKLASGQPWNQRPGAPNREYGRKRCIRKFFGRLTSPTRAYSPGNNEDVTLPT